MAFNPNPKPEKREKKKKKPLSRVKKKTGELAMFMQIWEGRPHVSEVSGTPIHQFDIRCFAHILSKGAYPSFRLKKENVLLVTPEEHHELDFGSTEGFKWKKVKLKKEELKREYYTKTKIAGYSPLGGSAAFSED